VTARITHRKPQHWAVQHRHLDSVRSSALLPNMDAAGRSASCAGFRSLFWFAVDAISSDIGLHSPPPSCSSHPFLKLPVTLGAHRQTLGELCVFNHLDRALSHAESFR
jgi:hypothetical protein